MAGCGSKFCGLTDCQKRASQQVFRSVLRNPFPRENEDPQFGRPVGTRRCWGRTNLPHDTAILILTSKDEDKLSEGTSRVLVHYNGGHVLNAFWGTPQRIF